MNKLLTLGIVMCALAAAGANYSKELAEVKAGTRKAAKASWWGFNKKDATKCLQSAINSGVKKLVVDNVGSDWIVTPIKAADNQEIIFEDGVVLRAKKGAFKKLSDYLFEINKRKNVIVRGQGNVLFVMNKSDYRNPKLYKKGEHRHTLRIWQSENVRVENLHLKSSGGDGIYLGAGKSSKSKNIVLKKLICEDHYRQGISITGKAENVLIKDCKFNDTEGTAPQCGLDYEPNYSTGALINCVFDNCDFNNNGLAGICIACPHLKEGFSLTFKNCRIRNNNSGILVISTGANANPSRPGKLEFINCTVSGSRFGSVTVSEHRVQNLAVIFKNCTIDNRKSTLTALMISSRGREDLFGVKIDGLTVIDDSKRPPIKFLSRFGNAMKNPVIARVKTRDSQGREKILNCAKFIKDSRPSAEARSFKTAPLNLRNLVPLREKGVIAGKKIRYRQKSTHVVFVKKGENAKIKFTNIPVHRFKSRAYRDPLEVAVFSPTGAPLNTLYVPFDKSLEYTLNAHQTGVYRFAANARMQTLSVETAAPGGPLAAEKLYIFGCSGRLYFHVPAGVKNIVLEATGVRREESSVWLLNPKGKTVASGIKMAGSTILKFTRPDGAKAEVWSIKFGASKLFVRIGKPLMPVFAANPANLLVAKGKSK